MGFHSRAACGNPKEVSKDLGYRTLDGIIMIINMWGSCQAVPARPRYAWHKSVILIQAIRVPLGT